MDNPPDIPLKFDGELVGELLDQIEYPSNVGNVAAVSDRLICFLRRDHEELVHFKLDFLDVNDCRAIDYQKETAYYRIVVAVAFFFAAAYFLFLLATDPEGINTENAPFIVAVVAFITLGIRFATSTHRHIMHFEMPGETLTWRSPATDFKFKAEAAHAVREFARKRGILREKEA